jgi:hypothetical protein
VQARALDNLSGVVDSLRVLRTGEAIIIGEAAASPCCRVTLPGEENRPQSGDPLVTASWSAAAAAGNYKMLAAAWRSQNPRWKPDPEKGD